MQHKKKINPIIVLVWQLLLISKSINLAKAECIDDFKPCFCNEIPDLGQQVICYHVPFKDIQNAFATNTNIRDLNKLELLPAPTESDPLPANFLSDFRVRTIYLATCNIPIEIDDNAFLSSSDYMEEFYIIDCDIDKLSWYFLNRFSKLNRLQLEFVNNIHSLSNLPPIESVKLLSIVNSKGFELLADKFPSSSLKGLESLVMIDNSELEDSIVNSILSTNPTTLKSLSLINSPYVSKVPDKVADLINLNSIDLSQCRIQSITSNSLAFSSRTVRLVNLKDVFLSSISDNAFENGYYGEAQVHLDNNALTDFKSTVYLKILNDMQKSDFLDSSFVSIENNPIKCDDCKLAWLIRDLPELLAFVSGSCSNSTRFEDLNPDWYEDKSCPSILTTTTQLLTTTSEITSSTTETPTDTITTTGDTETSTETEETKTTSSSKETSSNTVTTDETSTQTYETTLTTRRTITTPSNSVASSNSPTTLESGSSTSKTASLSTIYTTSEPLKPPEENDETLFYILIGLLAFIALVLICAFIYLVYINKKERRKSRNSKPNANDSLPSSLDRMVTIDAGQNGAILTRGSPFIITPDMNNSYTTTPGRVRGLRRIPY